MAKGPDTKLYVALGLLAVLGGVYYFQTQKQKEEAAEHSVAGKLENLPEIGIDEEATKKVDRIVIGRPAKAAEGEGEAEPAVEHVLVKSGESWKLEKPVDYPANDKNVESLLSNLAKLEVKERIAEGKDSYESYELTEEKALHVVVKQGDDTALEMWIGQSGGRGQTVRLAGHDGVYALDGFSKFLYGRDTKSWRDTSFVEVDKDAVTRVEIDNEQGEFVFEKKDDEWTGKFQKEGAFAASSIDEFEPKKVEDLLRAYKTVRATGFGDDMTLMAAGLDQPRATIRFFTGGEEPSQVVLIGDDGEGSSRWAKTPDREQIFAISSWASDWAVAEPKKFQKKDEEEGDEDDAATPPPGMGMPPGMEMPSPH